MFSVRTPVPRPILPAAFHVPIEGAASFCRAAVHDAYSWSNSPRRAAIEASPLEEIRHGLHENCGHPFCCSEEPKRENMLVRLGERLGKAGRGKSGRLRIEDGKMKVFEVEESEGFDEEEYESGLGEFGSMLHKVRSLSRKMRRRRSGDTECTSESEEEEVKGKVDMYEDEFISFACGNGRGKRRGFRGLISKIVNRI